MIAFIYKVIELVNSDPLVSQYMHVSFLPNFGVAVCELFVSAADISQHISSPGSEVTSLLTSL